MTCKYCQAKFQIGTYFYSDNCCLKCYQEGKSWQPEVKREKIGKWSGARGKKAKYDW